MSSIWRRVVPDAFLLILIAAVVLASVLPARGKAGVVLGFVSTGAIVMLFFMHGARLPREALTAALTHWRLHLTILTSTFILFPLTGWMLATLWPDLLPDAYWLGVLFLCTLPSTVQSSIAFTSLAHGNVAGSVTAAALSNLIGVVLSPIIVSVLANTQSTSFSFSGIWKICLQLLLPFVLGHLMRPWLGEWAVRRRRLLSFTDRGTIVLAVYTAFSAAIISGLWQELPMSTLGILLAICIALLAFMLLVTRYGSRALGFTRADEISTVLCGSQKSLVSGVPMARVLFQPADAGVAILPVMLFHQLQLMVCAWLARRYSMREGE